MWNVKQDAYVILEDACEVLIETLWNVKNGYVLGQINKGNRINRNIVECKDNSFSSVAGASLVLIETLWNVKYINRINFKMYVLY